MTGSKQVLDSGTFEHIPSEDERKRIIETALAVSTKVSYKGMECFCTKCKQYFTVDKKTFRQARYSQVCPKCFRSATYTTKTELVERKWIAIDGLYGYRVVFRWKWGEEPTASIKQVLYYNPNDGYFYRRGVVMGMGYHLNEVDSDEWRKIVAGRYGYTSDYTMYFYDCFIPEPMTKREWYAGSVQLKSDQVKLATQNIWTKNQLEYMKAFDLHAAEDVDKYSGYMKRNPIGRPDLGLNIHYLRYLVKNGIKLSDYVDYMNDCKFLGIKLDKPKDFQERHQQYALRVDEIRNKGIDDKIRKRAKKLIRTSYDDGDFTITPIGSRNELKDTAKHLHNCMMSYAVRYGAGDVDLYVMRNKGIDIVAIEVSDRTLKQARIDDNGVVPAELRKTICAWLKANKFEKGEYVW